MLKLYCHGYSKIDTVIRASQWPRAFPILVSGAAGFSTEIKLTTEHFLSEERQGSTTKIICCILNWHIFYNFIIYL